MEIATLVIQIVTAIASELIKAFGSGDTSVLDKPIRDLLPEELKTSLARKLAEEKAAQKLGPR